MAKNKDFCKLLKVKQVNEKALIEQLGITTKELQAWKSGEVRPHILYVKKTAQLLKMPMEELWEMFKSVSIKG